MFMCFVCSLLERLGARLNTGSGTKMRTSSGKPVPFGTTMSQTSVNSVINVSLGTTSRHKYLRTPPHPKKPSKMAAQREYSFDPP
eukprot:2937298-Amphidinium_carterae.1